MRGQRHMNTKPVYLTAEGLERLKAELNELITVDRPRVAARIHEAKLDGDLSENAEDEDAKQEQSFLEGRIATRELQLRNAAVIEKVFADTGNNSEVVIKRARKAPKKAVERVVTRASARGLTRVSITLY